MEVITKEMVDGAIKFHGHWCPGLAIGIRASELAMMEMEVGRAEDEEIVAITETDMCGVDAIQYLTGCTFGKGNLIFKDTGKKAFSFFRRGENEKSVRILTKEYENPEAEKLRDLHRKMGDGGLSRDEINLWKKIRKDMSDFYMESCLEDIFEVKETMDQLPGEAIIYRTLICSQCSEPVMESRTENIDGKVVCFSCVKG